MPTAKSLSEPKIILRELTSAEIPSIFPLIAHLNPGLGKKGFLERLAAMMKLGYRVVVAYQGKKMVGLSGFWVGMRFWCGKQFDIDNFVIHPEHRGQKIGEKLMVWLEKKALSEKCDLMVLDVYADNFLAHRFYQRAGFSATGYHFTKIPGSNTPYERKR